MHDNSLARALIGIGWDIQLIPTYTPIRTDEDSVTIDQVYFGGINLYLQQKIPLFRHVPQVLDRMFDNPWLIKKLTAKASETSPELLGGLSVSMLKGMHGNQKKEVRRLVSWLKKDVKPDALLLTNVLIAGFVPYFKQQLDVPVAVMLQGDDIFLDSLPEKYETQAVKEIRRLGNDIDAFIYHSQFYAEKMNHWFGLDSAKTHITPLTIDTTDFQNGTPALDASTTDSDSGNAANGGAVSRIPSDRKVVGYLARIAPEKGMHHLVDAFIQIKKRESDSQSTQNAFLVVAGWLGDHNRAYANEQLKKLDEAGLSEDYLFLGTIERSTKIELLKRIDVFSVPTEYHEPKGLYVLESMACGTPVVQPDHGAFPELIQSTGGGLLCASENSEDLSKKISSLLDDDPRRLELGDSGKQSVLTQRGSATMAADTARVFQQLLNSERF